MTPHQKRRFPEKVDFLTSAGYLNGNGSRNKIGLRGKGPVGVVTDIGFLEPDENGELILTSLHPGKSVQQAKDNTGWELKISHNLGTSEPVTEGEIRILREELDPSGIYLKSG
jgi:glutaconate CoA-transferase subunit B